MKRILGSILLCVVVCSGAYSARVGNLHIYVPQEITRGSMERLYIWSPESIPELTVVIANQAGATLASGRTFPIPASFFREASPGVNVSAGFLAVDLLGKAGQGVVKILDARGKLVFSQAITFVVKDHVSEDIKLTKELSSIVQTPNPRADREARELAAAFSGWEPSSVLGPGLFRLPLEADVKHTGGFGDTRRYIYNDGTSSADYHRGIDFAAHKRSEVFAAAPGRVVLATERYVTGWSVVIEHMPGVFTCYYHLDQILVKVGQEVPAGTLIAYSGATGLATGPHLHWELRVNKVPADPWDALTTPFLDARVILGLIAADATHAK